MRSRVDRGGGLSSVDEEVVLAVTWRAVQSSRLLVQSLGEAGTSSPCVTSPSGSRHLLGMLAACEG